MADSGGPSGSEKVAFSVDTHLLRELGSLLVGRDSTAVVELIKNAYDADATTVVIHGEGLRSHGSVTIRDDGHGMSYEDFIEKFLRIAGRSKEGGLRRSPLFERKYTGAKGIGRLAAHKLGSNLLLESSPKFDEHGSRPVNGIQARIDWDALESSESSIEDANDIVARRTSVTAAGPSGTTLTINRLHSAWTTRQLSRFLSEVRSTRPDSTLYTPVGRDVLPGGLLVPSAPIADSTGPDPGFTLHLSGEFADSESQWPTLLAHLNWVLEVDARSVESVTYRIAPTAATLRIFPTAQPRQFEWARPEPGPMFYSRVFIRGGVGSNNASRESGLKDLLQRFSAEAAGVRVYFEGFRVLPYGSARNDWLGLDEAYVRRESLGLLEDFDDELPPSDNDERTYAARNANHFGAVFLHDEASAGLKMVVNREGFLPSEEYEQIVTIMRRGLNLGTRVRAALGAVAKSGREEEKAEARAQLVRELQRPESNATPKPPLSREPASVRFETIISAGRAAAADLRSTPVGKTKSDSVAIIEAALEEARAASERVRDEQSQLRVLASLGTQVGAFVHEVNGLLGQARVVRDSITRLIDEGHVASGTIGRWRQVSRAQNELVAGLERQAIYLADSIGAEARRRRVRISPSAAWTTASRLLSDAAARRGVILENEMPGDMKLRPMFPAEINVVLTNLLSNAIKAASASGTGGARVVRARAGRSDSGSFIIVENTGIQVDPVEGERWFKPFESTTSELDSELGQGLGLGLPLTRRIIEEYGGSIEFVTPDTDMATAVRVVLPDR